MAHVGLLKTRTIEEHKKRGCAVFHKAGLGKNHAKAEMV